LTLSVMDLCLMLTATKEGLTNVLGTDRRREAMNMVDCQGQKAELTLAVFRVCLAGVLI
jgi:hypothetical protein